MKGKCRDLMCNPKAN